MKIVKSIVLLTACLFAVRAQEQTSGQYQPQQQQQQQEQEHQEQIQSPSENPTTESSEQLPPQAQFNPSDELTPKQIILAKKGIEQILEKLPVQHFEPLVTSREGFCSAFGSLCKAACMERRTEENAGEEAVMGCPSAATSGPLNAVCKCAGADLTERVNFAVAGGFVSDASSSPKDEDPQVYHTEGILDVLDGVPIAQTFLSIIHILQTACYYISFLDVLANNSYKQSGCSKGPLSSIVGSIPIIGPLLGGLFGGADTSEIGVSTPSVTSSAVPSPTSTSRLFIDIFPHSKDGKKSQLPEVEESGGQVVDDDQPVQEYDDDDEKENLDNAQPLEGNERPDSNDGRGAGSVQAQERYIVKIIKDRDMYDL
ncbi:hypothetical protein BGX28_009975 [Mortierella sp. GBA30]|nr:hypothetical protein BGX28_009975 [Mortierella sp. GBA30]